MGLGDLFKSKTEKAIQKALDSTKDNITRIKALDHLEELARGGDDQCLQALIKCFHITVKKDQQEQSLAPYDDEAEKKALIERLAGFDDPRRVIKHLRKELATPPWLTPGRRDGVVFMIELMGELAEAASEGQEDADRIMLDELVLALGSYEPEESYRTPERKVELVRAVGRHRAPKAAEAIVPFLKDVDETVRFSAADSLAVAGNDTLGEALAEVILEDESLRIREKAAEVIADLQCSIKGHPRRKELEAAFPKDVTVDKQGVVRRRKAQ